ncbi:uncharacterized protein YdeI (BOF family) [Peptoniphilus olsenii]|uniref:Uncharacterized protein YdeI (BOF family) n=1 Tax=Peptoniphilus olsenii TaxID=411570 RepID=A0ABV2J7K3_9FIRM
MTYKEAVKAMRERQKVKLGGIVYKHINAIIFRKTKTAELIQVELQDDSNYNAVTVAKIEKVEKI